MMAERRTQRSRLALFAKFEETLSAGQRQFLQQNPDMVNPDLVVALYQASTNRLSHVHEKTHSLIEPPPNTSHVEAVKKKRRKVVNSWMAFRSYYSSLIKDLPQKARSPMLALLWKHDVDKALWEIISSSFSYIRDHHSEDAISLDQFLSTAVQVVPIVTLHQYFARCGWHRAGDTLQRTDGQHELPKATNVSCAGLVRYCYRQGLISRPPSNEQVDLQVVKNRVASTISFATIASPPVETMAEEGCRTTKCAGGHIAIKDSVVPRSSSQGPDNCVSNMERENAEATDDDLFADFFTFDNTLEADTEALGGHKTMQAGLLSEELSVDSANVLPGFLSNELGGVFNEADFLVDEFWNLAE